MNLTSERIRKHLTERTAELMDRLFCTSCQTMAPIEGGKYRQTSNGRKRFTCLGCEKRISALVKRP